MVRVSLKLNKNALRWGEPKPTQQLKRRVWHPLLPSPVLLLLPIFSLLQSSKLLTLPGLFLRRRNAGYLGVGMPGVQIHGLEEREAMSRTENTELKLVWRISMSLPEELHCFFLCQREGMAPIPTPAEGSSDTWLKAGLSDALDLEFWCQKSDTKSKNGSKSFALVATAQGNRVIPKTWMPRASLELLQSGFSASPVLWTTAYPSNKFTCLLKIPESASAISITEFGLK